MVRCMAGLLALAVLLVASVAAERHADAVNSISYSPANPTTETGVSFTVSTGGGNRDFASVVVNCVVDGDPVYSTVLTVSVPPKGTGTSQAIYPPASSCTADLVKLMQIGKVHLLASVSFEVAEAGP